MLIQLIKGAGVPRPKTSKLLLNLLRSLNSKLIKLYLKIVNSATNKYLNNIVELCTHRLLKQLVNTGIGFLLIQYGKANDQTIFSDEYA